MKDGATRQPGQADAFKFLRDQAIEAHLAGDGLRVLHLCQVGLKHIPPQATEKLEIVAHFESARWCFSLMLYWALDHHTFFDVDKGLTAFAEVEELQWDVKVLRYVLAMLLNPFASQELDEMLAVPGKWLKGRSTEREDIVLLTFAVELAWTCDSPGEPWQTLADTWLQNCPANSLLENSLKELLKRLRSQTSLALGQWPAGCESTDRDIPEEPLAEGYRLFTQCDWKGLDEFIRDWSPRTQTDDPLYIPLFRLIHWTRFYRRAPDDQFLSLSRYQHALSRQPAEVYEMSCWKRFSEKSAALSKISDSGEGAPLRVDRFHLARTSQLMALRRWDFIAWMHGVQREADASLELAHQGEQEFASQAVVKSVRALGVPNDKKDPRFRRAVELLDLGPETPREAVVRELISSHPVQWGDAYYALDAMSDAIPESMLPDVACWSVELEMTPLVLRNVRASYLGFWGDILGYTDNANLLVDILKPALLQTCERPPAWREIEDTLTKSLVAGKVEVATEVANKLISLPQAEKHFEDHRWNIVFNASASRHELRELCSGWLQEHIGGDPNRDHYMKRMEAGYPEGPIDDSGFRDYSIDRAKGLATQMQRTDTTSISFGALLDATWLRLVTWPPEDMAFVKDLVKAVDAENAMPNEKLSILQILAELVNRGPDPVVNELFQNGIRWLEKGVPYHDFAGDHSGPLSAFTMRGNEPALVERGLWWFGYALLRRRPDEIQELLYRRVLREGLRQQTKSADVVFAIMVRLALTAPPEEASRAMGITGMSEALATSVAAEQMGRLVRTFGSLLKPTEEGGFSISQAGENESGKMLIESWSRRLLDLSNVSLPDVRAAVAEVLHTWSGLPGDYPWIPFSQELADAFERLKTDARARVRWACTAHE